jgi:hypothetical protein
LYKEAVLILEERKKTHGVGDDAIATKVLYIKERRKTNTRKNGMIH